MVTEINDFADLEIELRQSLLKGYTRARQIEAREDPLGPAECVLTLLGDPQVLNLEASGWIAEIPLVYVAQKDLKDESPGRGITHIYLDKVKDEHIVTPYRRRVGSRDPVQMAMHKRIVDPLQQYLQTDRGFLLDVIWAPRMDVDDHHYVVRENWAACRTAPSSPDQDHWLFGPGWSAGLPSAVHAVNALIRLTFPPSSEWRQKETEERVIVTLVLGLALKRRPRPEDDLSAAETEGRPFRRTSDGAARGLMGLVRRVSQILMSEVPQLYDWLQRPQGRHSPTRPRPPGWLKARERDPLHQAVDDLHLEVNRLALRVDAEPSTWSDPKQGFNFLIAFKELNDGYRAALRYCLSLQNLHAFGTTDGVTDLESWRNSFENALVRLRDRYGPRVEALKNLLFAEADAVAAALEAQGKHDEAAHAKEEKQAEARLVEEKWQKHLTGCRYAIRHLFEQARTMDDVRERLMLKIENAPYRLQLTPGYWVMSLGHPEIVENWLRDPRSDGLFREDYPPDLLLWENSAIRGRLYYSPITDGVVPVGVCGINADILRRCSAYELQQIIDESGGRFRRILSRRELDGLRKDLRNRHLMLEGQDLWLPALEHFRRLAYYHFPDPWDFHTKLVCDEAADGLGIEWQRKGELGLWFQAAGGITEEQSRGLMNAGHLAARWRDDERDDDFIKRELEEREKRNEREKQDTWPLSDARLHRVRIPLADDANLLVLTRSRHDQYMQELVDSFTQNCWSALVGDEPGPRQPEGSTAAAGVRVEPPTGGGAAALESLVAGGSPPWVFVAHHPDDGARAGCVVRGLRNGLVGQSVWWWDPASEQRGWYAPLREAVAAGHVRTMLVMVREGGLGLHQEQALKELARMIDQRGGVIVPLVPPGASGSPEAWPEFLRVHRHEMLQLESLDDVEPLVAALARPRGIKVFVSYSHRDAEFVNREDSRSLIRYLEGLQRDRFSFVVDRLHLISGDAWEQKLADELATSDIMLMLVSQDYLTSAPCQVERRQAQELWERKRLRTCVVRLSAAPALAHDDWLPRLHQLPEKAGETVKEHWMQEGARERFYEVVYEHLRRAGEEIRAAR